MKKYFVSAAVVIAFAAYVFWRNHPDDDAGTVSVPTSTTQTDQPSSGAAAPDQASSSTPPAATSAYKDGTYTSPVEDAFYGNLQISVVINAGKITDVTFLQYP